LNLDPSKRSAGHVGLLGMVVMVGTTACAAFQQLGWTPKNIKFLHWEAFGRGILSVCYD